MRRQPARASAARSATIAAGLLARRTVGSRVVATRPGRGRHCVTTPAGPVVRRPRRSRTSSWPCDARCPDLAVLVDDADELLDTPLEPPCSELAALVDRDAGLIVVGAEAERRVGAVPRPRGRRRPTPHRHPARPGQPGEADLFGPAGAGRPSAVPGRGHLVRAGVATTLQVARPCGSLPADPEVACDYGQEVTLTPDLAALGDEKFVSLTTFRKSGAAVPHHRVDRPRRRHAHRDDAERQRQGQAAAQRRADRAAAVEPPRQASTRPCPRSPPWPRSSRVRRRCTGSTR